MRKFYIILFVAIILFFSATANASDLILDQWIYDAVEYLDEFKIQAPSNGIRSLNRYQVALSLANTIQSLDSAHSSVGQRFGISRDIYLKQIVQDYNESLGEGKRLPEEYLNVLSKLAVEFREELVVLGYAIQDADDLLLSHSEKKEFQMANSLMILKNEKPLNKQSSVYFSERYGDLYTLFEAENTNKDLILDSLIPLSEDFILGASLTLHETDEQLQVPGIAGLAGKYLINNDLILEGQYMHKLDAQPGSSIFQLGATVKLGDLELGGVLRSLQSRLDNEELQSRAGYELSLRLGDLMVSTGRDPLNNIENPSNSLYTTSVDLKYGMPDSILFSAGYQVESELKAVHELGNPSATSLGLDIPIPQGKIKFGLTQEKTGGNSGEDSDPSLDPEGQNDLGGKQTALVGISYALNSETDFKLHYYRLVNFDDMGSNSHDYTAEFSFRF